MYSKIILLFLFVQLMIITSLAKQNEPCFHQDYKFFNETRSCYKIHTTPKTWSDAVKICASENADLLVVENQTEADLIGLLMRETIKDPTPPWTKLSVFVGITDSITEGSFKTIDGRSISNVYCKWYPFQPDNNHFTNVPENCVQLFDDGFINDYLCSSELPFICKKALDSPQNNQEKSKQNEYFFRNDYEYKEITRSFYKKHTIPTTWIEAQRICAAESANLLVVEDQNEANVIISLMEETIMDQSLPKPLYTTMHVGISDLVTEGAFKTIDGRSISYVYNKWHKGQPSSIDDNEDCVEIFPDGTLNDIGCDHILRYICKKTLDSLHMPTKDNANPQREPFFRRDYEYSKATRSFYRLHSAPKTWLEAKKTCANENAKLLVIEDQNEADVVLSYINKTHHYSVYVGISHLVAKGVYETIDGRPISHVYNKWKEGEPNNHNGLEACLEITKNSELNDMICERPLPFICKKTLDSLQWNKKCEMSFMDYDYNETLNRCYKFHSNPLNWTDAHELCAAEQSYLAVINSQDEADYFIQLIEEYNKNRSGSCLYNQVFLGFHNQLNEGWTTVRGTTLEDSGYAKWSPGQPDSDRDKCGSMVYDGHLNDVACDKKIAYLCEHEIDAVYSADARFSGEIMTNVQ